MNERIIHIQSILKNDSDMSETNRWKLKKELNQLRESDED